MEAPISYEFHSEFNDRYTTPTRRMVRILSENSRTTISEIADAMELSRRTIKERLLKTEKALGMQYTIEFNEEALGLTAPHMIVVELEKKPDYEYVRKLLLKSPMPQLAFTIKGKNRIFIYAVGTTHREYAHWDNVISVLLSEYGINWHSSEVMPRQLGFVPLRTDLIDRLSIDGKYKPMLKMLNENSRATFRQMSTKLDMHFNTVIYNFNRLLKSNYIKRFTLTMAPQPNMCTMAFWVKYSPRKDLEKSTAKLRKAFMSDDRYSIASRYMLCAPLIGSYDHFGIGVFDSYGKAYEHLVQYHRQSLGHHMSKIFYGEVDRVLVGRLPMRSIDTKADYRVINWTADMEEL